MESIRPMRYQPKQRLTLDQVKNLFCLQKGTIMTDALSDDDIRQFREDPRLMRQLAKFRYPRSTLLGVAQRRLRIRPVRIPKGWIDLCVRLYSDNNGCPTNRFTSDLIAFLQERVQNDQNAPLHH